MDEVTIFVEPQHGFADAVHVEAAKQLGHLVKTSIGITATIKLCATGALKRSEGKIFRVRDLRPKVPVDDGLTVA
jgi:phenylacetate-CoA ligase